MKCVQVTRFLLLSSFLVFVVESAEPLRYSSRMDLQHSRCEQITNPLCKGLQYNETVYPNVLGNRTQDDAGMEMLQFLPLLKAKCSYNIRFFLCSMYIPVCTVTGLAVPPCRSLCDSVRLDCERMMSKLGFEWPEVFNCTKFPEHRNRDQLCVHENNINAFHKRIYSTASSTTSLPQKTKTRIQPDSFGNNSSDMKLKCPSQLTVTDNSDYVLRLGDHELRNCGAPCDRMFFDDWEKKFLRMWIGFWSILCLISSLFATLNFLIDATRFPYPQRPIMYLSFCYLMISLSYSIGFSMENHLTCDEPTDETVSLIHQGTKHSGCTATFVLLYFFGMASSIWWVILTLTFFMETGLKWGYKNIEDKWRCFHATAWGVPTVQTLWILASGEVEGDDLSGVCYVGVWNSSALGTFVLTPLCVYLALGTLFLVSSLFSLLRSGTDTKHVNRLKVDQQEKKLKARIAIFSIFYIVYAVILIACYLYEHENLSSWMTSWQCAQGVHFFSLPCPQGATITRLKPNSNIFLLKYHMTMAMGIISSVWILSSKTWKSWRNFCNRDRQTTNENELAQLAGSKH